MDRPLQSFTLLDQEAIVTLTIAPGRAGQVQFQGSWWKARCAQSITLLPETRVYVVDRLHVTTLYVEPVEPVEPAVDLPLLTAIAS